ncbi:MAG: DUF6468 domain-containing protein [Phenylobacterium sp.]|uniref:DUF6468 domain-containing protein n=1 Tax=Phenylobacterium sp. TaxID=1871053 RepID=UPI002733E04D|nr:DUF6468 domain-containing protein [Phenylobacterium sp.]MDP3174685.1 DUF6468 domain-containing protein [Phenylobacterium sp.]
MSIIAIGLNLLLASLLAASLVLGWRLNRRLRALRDSQEGFAKAVAELDQAARRAETGLASLRAATDEATEALADRIDKARVLTAKLERLTAQAPQGATARDETPPLELNIAVERSSEGRLGALLSAARQGKPRLARVADLPISREQALARGVAQLDDDLFEPASSRSPLRGRQ